MAERKVERKIGKKKVVPDIGEITIRKVDYGNGIFLHPEVVGIIHNTDPNHLIEMGLQPTEVVNWSIELARGRKPGKFEKIEDFEKFILDRIEEKKQKKAKKAEV